MVSAAPTPMLAFPKTKTKISKRHVEISEGSFYLQRELENGNALGRLIEDYAQSLHVHDVSVRVILPATYEWSLRWCRLERCLKLDIGTFTNTYEIWKLETFWASELLMTRWIWSESSAILLYFKNLCHLHLLQDFTYARPLALLQEETTQGLRPQVRTTR